MNKLLSRFDKMMAAVTFAEAGEHETAKELMRETAEETRKAVGKCPHCGEKVTIDCMPHPNEA